MRARCPLEDFYRELLHTQRVLYSKHLTWWTTPQLAGVLARNLLRGQTNFLRGIMNYNKVYSVEKMLADHARPVHYELPRRPEATAAPAKAPQLYIHEHRGRGGRSIDDSTERFVDSTRMQASG